MQAWSDRVIVFQAPILKRTKGSEILRFEKARYVSNNSGTLSSWKLYVGAAVVHLALYVVSEKNVLVNYTYASQSDISSAGCAARRCLYPNVLLT